MRARNLAWAVLLGVLPVAAGGCAKKAPPISSAPLNTEDARVFDHGVDFVAALGGLEGRWRTDYDKDLDVRAGASDFVAIVRIDTVHSDTDPEQRVVHRLVGPVQRVLFGEDLKEVELASEETFSGYTSVHDNLARIQSETFLAYVKWYRADSGRRQAHFHLSPAAEEIITQTEARLALRESHKGTAGGETVTVHTN